jgi:hypothetical protein
MLVNAGQNESQQTVGFPTNCSLPRLTARAIFCASEVTRTSSSRFRVAHIVCLNEVTHTSSKTFHTMREVAK